MEWTAEGPTAVDGALAVDGPGARAGEVVWVARTGVDLCSRTATSGIARHVALLTVSMQHCARRRRPLANSILATRGGFASRRPAKDSNSAPTSLQVSVCKIEHMMVSIIRSITHITIGSRNVKKNHLQERGRQQEARW